MRGVGHPCRSRRVCAASLGAVGAAAVARNRAGPSPPDLTGLVGTVSRPAGRRDESAAGIQPPLKANLLAEWQARRAAERAADARGEPIARATSTAFPTAVPSMMSGPFPFEIVQSRDADQHRAGGVQPDSPHLLGQAATDARRHRARVLWPLGRHLGRQHARRRYDRHQRLRAVSRRAAHARNADHGALQLVRRTSSGTRSRSKTPRCSRNRGPLTFAYRRMPDYEIIEYVCEDNREYADEKASRGCESVRLRSPPVARRAKGKRHAKPDCAGARGRHLGVRLRPTTRARRHRGCRPGGGRGYRAHRLFLAAPRQLGRLLFRRAERGAVSRSRRTARASTTTP